MDKTKVETKVRLLKSDVAAVTASREMGNARTTDGAKRSLRKGLLNPVLLRNKSDQLIVVLHNMELLSL
jgi:hypothetical protein